MKQHSNPKKLSRRDFLKLCARWGLGSIPFLLGGWHYASNIEPGWVEVVEQKLTLPRLPRQFSGLRLAQISDLHISEWMNPARLETVVSTVIDLKPDIVAITGDFASHYSDQYFALHQDSCADVLSQLPKNVPTLAIMGNHDYWVGVEPVRRMLARANLQELRNQTFSLGRGADALHICGMDLDWHLRFTSIAPFLEQVPQEGCAVLLVHYPDFADFSAPSKRFDLQISGHSHGGQLIIPFLGAPILPYGAMKYPLGLYQVGEMYQYTNRGLGLGFLPYRINCRPEITVFTLESAAA